MKIKMNQSDLNFVAIGENDGGYIPDKDFMIWFRVHSQLHRILCAAALSRATPFRNITLQRGGADTAADGAQWCPAGSCPPLPLSAACTDLASGLG